MEFAWRQHEHWNSMKTTNLHITIADFWAVREESQKVWQACFSRTKSVLLVVATNSLRFVLCAGADHTNLWKRGHKLQNGDSSTYQSVHFLLQQWLRIHPQCQWMPVTTPMDPGSVFGIFAAMQKFALLSESLNLWMEWTVYQSTHSRRFAQWKLGLQLVVASSFFSEGFTYLWHPLTIQHRHLFERQEPQQASEHVSKQASK